MHTSHAIGYFAYVVPQHLSDFTRTFYLQLLHFHCCAIHLTFVCNVESWLVLHTRRRAPCHVTENANQAICGFISYLSICLSQIMGQNLISMHIIHDADRTTHGMYKS